MKKFEYKMVAPDLGEDIKYEKFSFDLNAKKLNELGKEGWELVSTIPQQQLKDETKYLNIDPRGDIIFIFKREII